MRAPTAARRADKPKGASVESIARTALSASRGDAAAAIRSLERQAGANVRLRAALVRYGAHHLVGQVFHHGREAAVRGAVVFPPANPSYLERASPDALKAIQDSYRGLLGWPLPGTGAPLGDATRKDVHAARLVAGAQRRGNAIDERFLGYVEQAARNPRTPIRSQLSAADLKALHERAEKAER